MSFEETKFYLGLGFQIINALATVGVWLYVRYGDRNTQIDKKFELLRDDFDRRADDQERRLARVEGHIERAPTHSDLAQVHEKLNTTAQAASQMAGQLQAMNDNLKLILNQIAQRGMQ